MLYPEWETASHAPTVTVSELAGLLVSVDGTASRWVRDPVDMHAFHVDVPKRSKSIVLDFQFLAPAQAHPFRPDMVIVPWQRVLLYPAGWYVRSVRRAEAQSQAQVAAQAPNPTLSGSVGYLLAGVGDATAGVRRSPSTPL